MKNKSIIVMLSIAAMSVLLVTTSCRKRKEFKNENGQSSEDNRNIQSQTDQGVSDANTAIGNYSSMSGRSTQLPSVLTTICGASIDSIGPGIVKINYDGTVCNNRKREGSIRLTILNYSSGVRWKNAGCVLQVEYLSYKVTRASDDKSIKFDGTHLVTNVNGGTWFDLIFLGQPSLIHTVTPSGALTCTFEDGKSATCNLNRKFTYVWANSVLTCTGEGTGSYNSLSNLENYGTTRNGDAFTSQVTTPVIWNTTCGAWAPVQGEVSVVVEGKEFNLICTFGVDASGNPVPVVANDCPYGWKLYWKYKKKDKTKIFGYH
ncbi:MAG: hypothetical protein HY841_06690 [Bacteroidetes bacterium]|nr:hypothetical protein [Bacteroidota bacterium]